MALALGLGAAVAAHAFPLERGRPRLPDPVDTFFEACRGEAGFYRSSAGVGATGTRCRAAAPRRVYATREAGFRRVAPPPPALSERAVDERPRIHLIM